MDISRRQFLKYSVSAGAMVMTIGLPFSAGATTAKTASSKTIEDNRNIWSVYLHINPDNSILIESPVQDMGQHMRTTGAMMIAEELCADWSLVSCIGSKVHIEKDGERYRHKYAYMGVGGSQSVKKNWQYLREAGAVAKRSLMQAAAKHWQCPVDELSCENSFVYRKTSQQKISYGALAASAATLPITDEPLKLKAKADYKILGTKTKTVDINNMLTGQPLYGIDMKMDNMLNAVIERSPYFHGTIKSYDDSAVLKVPGVVKTVKIDLDVNPRNGIKNISAGIAIVADSLWTAMKARKLLKVQWQQGPFANESNESLMADFKRFCHSDDSGRVMADVGNVTQGLVNAKRVFKQDYQTTHMAHACMEPFNAIVHAQKDRAVVVTGHQFPDGLASTVGDILGIDPINVEVKAQRMGGGFGRRAKSDYVIEAALIAKHFDQPVKVTWMREDDISQDYFGPAAYARLQVGVDDKGNIDSWFHKQGQISGRIVAGAFPNGLMPNYKADNYMRKAGTPIGAWRGPGHLQHTFAVESMIDEIAEHYGRDQLEYRLNLMGEEKEMEYKGWGADVINSKRMAVCYQQAADLANWQHKRPKGVGLGIAGHFTFGTYAAFVVEIDAREYLKGQGPMQIAQAWGAIDCGLPLNPNHIENQMQGGFIDGLNAALFNEVIIEGGQVQNTNFDSLRWMKMSEAPAELKVAIVRNDYQPTGVGEPPTAPAAAALSNAIFAATGKRFRQLPISLEHTS